MTDRHVPLAVLDLAPITSGGSPNIDATCSNVSVRFGTIMLANVRTWRSNASKRSPAGFDELAVKFLAALVVVGRAYEIGVGGHGCDRAADQRQSVGSDGTPVLM